MIDWAHESVSGHHAEVIGLDDAGVRVRVYGDNGIVEEGGARHGPGSEFTWRTGDALVLGTAADGEPACTLTLMRVS